MTIVGTAEILITANTSGFAAELKAETDGALDGIAADAGVAGADAGAALSDGVRDGTKGLEDDLADVGAASGVGLREGVRDGTSGLENDLALVGANSGVGLRDGVRAGTADLADDLGAIGAAGGLNLRDGVSDETGKLVDDVGKDAEDAGGKLREGIGGGLSKLAGVLSSTGLPLEALTTGLEKSGDAARDTDSKASGLVGSLEKFGGVAAVGVAAAGAVVLAAGVHMADGMQQADAAIAAAAGTSQSAAAKIGDAFEDTAFKSEFSSRELAESFSTVAGQLKSTEGHALNASEAMQVMSAADDLATAKQVSLGSATSDVAGIMQAFQLRTQDAAHVSDVLFSASTRTGTSIDSLSSSLEKIRTKLGDTSPSVGNLSALLVDMTDQGITGRGALTALSGSMTTLQKTGDGVQTALQTEKGAYDQLTPSLQKLAREYTSGAISSTAFETATSNLPPTQAALVSSFGSAADAVQTAQEKYKALGVSVFDAQGQFVGMGSIIDQLHSKFQNMSQQQQLAAASTLFGASAAKQMLTVINAGPAAYDAAAASVNAMGSAHSAAAKQADTLKVEGEELESGFGDLAGQIGQAVIPALTDVVHWLLEGTEFVEQHKAALIALAGVVTAILGPALAVFAVNKMASFVQSFQSAAGHISSFVGVIESAASSIIGMFTDQATAAEESADEIGAAQESMSADVSSEVAAMSAQNAELAKSFTAVGVAAGEGADLVEAAMERESSTVSLNDSGMEADNRAAAASLTTLEGDSATAMADVTADDTTIEAKTALARTDVAADDTTIQADSTAADASAAHGTGALGKLGAAAAALTGGFTVGQTLAGIDPDKNAGTVAPNETSQQPSAAPPLPKERKNDERVDADFKKWGRSVESGVKSFAIDSVTHVAKNTQQFAAQAVADVRKGSGDTTTEVAALTSKGTAELNKLLSAVHSASLKELNADLNRGQTASLSTLEKDITKAHTTALTKLDSELVKAHEQALKELTADIQKALTKQIDSINKAASVSQATAQAKADAITDATQVAIDKQAEAGLTGAALTAAKAQTAYDQVVAKTTAAVDAAQIEVAKASTSGQLAQAQAAAALADAQANQTVAEATAQATLTKANANATAAADAADAASAAAAPTADSTAATVPTPAITDTTATPASTTTTTAAAAAVAPTINLNIYGNGNMTPGQLFTEIGFAVTTGALPVAPPPPVPAAA